MIKKNKLRQELEIGTVFHLDLVSPIRSNNKWLYKINEIEKNKLTSERYARWIKKNEIEKYVDLSNPIYNPGKPLLGVMIEPHIEDGNLFNYWDKDYWMSGIYYTDD